MLSPELETLDQLLGGALAIHAVASLFNDPSHCAQALEAMLNAGELRLTDSMGKAVPVSLFLRLRSDPSFWGQDSSYRVEISDLGANRIA